MTAPSLPPPPPPLVTTRGQLRTLEFIAGDVQSAMLLSAPTRLVLAYCRAIMCFALFVPHPRHIIMVGLGGGSLLKFCYRHFPATRITVLESRADVIALRSQFAIPPDDARLQIVHADAAVWLAGQHAVADVLMVDGFDRSGLPPTLGSARFYGHCRRALCDGGVLVANIFSYDPAYPRMLARLDLMFDRHLCWFDGVAGNNRILFALKAGPRAAPSRALRLQQRLAKRQGLGSKWLNRLFVRSLIIWLSTK
ncbi:transferase spermidine synthase [Massilia sp. CF038]|uniref:spermine/spermidine synthase domain-containing protein n=1 Tax=Massilia sp. CF038 TaxID=1881045 RepID=UPI00091FBA63|nr:transferase spermidine synthase [Massilia sp. CF038]SHH04173.1 spermidine synthase [Massilia sp. CF038]